MEGAKGLRLEDLPLHFICFIGVTAQVLLLVAFVRNPLKCFRNSATYLVANLSVSDTLFLIFGFAVSTQSSWYALGPIAGFIYATSYVSIFTMFSIAIDRYLMVVYPFKHRYLMSGKRSAVWIAFTWIMALFFPAKNFIFGRTSQFDSQIITILALVITLASGLAYTLTFLSLRNQARCLAAQENHSGNHSQGARVLKEKEFVKTIIIVCCVTMLTLPPLVIFSQVGLTQDPSSYNNKFNKILRCILTTLFYCNFAVNPFIYIWRLPKYRKSIYLMLRCKNLNV